MREKKWFTIRYDEGKDAFQIWLNTENPEKGDEWGFCYGCSCLKRPEDEQAELIHYSVLTKVRDLLNQGWKYYRWRDAI